MRRFWPGLALLLLLTANPAARAEPCREYFPDQQSSRQYDLTGATRYHAIASRDEFLYFCSRSEGNLPRFWCFRLESSINGYPVVMSNVHLPTSAGRIVFSGDHAVLAMGFEGLGLVDISNPAALTPVQLTPTGDVCRDVALLGNDQVVTAEWSALRIYDLRDPAAPEEISGITLVQARTVAVMDNFAYVACGNLGLAVVDVSNPAVPSLVTQLPVGGFVDQVAAESGRVYLTGYLLGLVTVDVADPNSPSVAWTLPFAGEAEDVLTRDGYAYVPVGGAVMVVPGIYYDAMALVRLNRPGPPVLVDYYFPTQDFFSLALGADRVFLGESHDSAAGLHQAPLQCPAVSGDPLPGPAQVALSGPWPNPFNPRVSVGFTLPAGLAGWLRVYDVGGRLVAEIWRGPGRGSTMTATWDGSDQRGRSCPSGVYRFVLSSEPGGILAQTSGALLR